MWVFEVGTCNPTPPVQVFSVVLQPYQWTAKWIVTVYMYVFILKCQMRYKVLDICSLTISSYKQSARTITASCFSPCLGYPLEIIVIPELGWFLVWLIFNMSKILFWTIWKCTNPLKAKADSYPCAICCTVATKLCEISATVVLQKSTHS